MTSENIQEILTSLLGEAIATGITPGGVAAVEFSVDGQRKSYSGAAGITSFENKSKEVSIDTAYDLASLTKPLVTSLLVMVLVERGEIKLSDRLETLIDDFYVPADKRNIEIQHLLSHSSGFVAHRPYFCDLIALDSARREKALVSMILSEPLNNQPGTTHCYSDLGYILLGYILEAVTGKKLDTLYSTMILDPLGLSDQLWFNRSKRKKEHQYAATEICPWSHKLLSGTVHDDNCRAATAGVNGHAGLFGTMRGVMGLCRLILDVYKGMSSSELFSQKRIEEWLTRYPHSTWSLGFDSPSGEGSSSGSYFSEKTRGHLGFTGTSFWIDFEQSIIVVLLTNRVHPTRTNWGIRQFRPYFHNRVMEALNRKTP